MWAGFEGNREPVSTNLDLIEGDGQGSFIMQLIKNLFFGFSHLSSAGQVSCEAHHPNL